MPNFRISLTITQVNALCDQRGYQAIVPNPAHIPGQPIDLVAVPPVNPPTIPNPQTKDAFVAEVLRNFFDGEVAAGKRKTRDVARAAEDEADRIALRVAAPVVS